jgi:hypothetical protein
MMAVFSFMIVSYNLLVLSCDNSNDLTNEKKEIDSRLVGGKWFSDRGNNNPNSFYRFTETTYGIASNGEETIILTPAYSENGKILAINSGAILLHYEFITTSYYDTELATAIANGDHLLIYAVEVKIQAAKNGHIVKFTIPGSSESFEWARWGNVILGPNAEIPSFLHGAWYRAAISNYATGEGFVTKVEKLIFNENSFTSFGYDHYVSDPEDITFYSNDYTITYSEDLNVNEVIFNVNYSNPFTFRYSGNYLILSTTIYDNSGTPISREIHFWRQKSETLMPEWAVGNFSTTNSNFNNFLRSNYPFAQVIYHFTFRNIGFVPGIVIREYIGYDPWVWSSSDGYYSFKPIASIPQSSYPKVDKMRFYFDEYFLERELTENIFYIGSTNENNVFYEKIRVYRMADLPRTQN